VPRKQGPCHQQRAGSPIPSCRRLRDEYDIRFQGTLQVTAIPVNGVCSVLEISIGARLCLHTSSTLIPWWDAGNVRSKFVQVYLSLSPETGTFRKTFRSMVLFAFAVGKRSI
jgi:hypothetical protein